MIKRPEAPCHGCTERFVETVRGETRDCHSELCPKGAWLKYKEDLENYKKEYNRLVQPTKDGYEVEDFLKRRLHLHVR